MTGRAGSNGSVPRDTTPPDAPSAADATGVLRRVVRIVNPLGLHHRVADRFSRTARQFSCAVTVRNGDVQADGKSLWDLIMLVALPDAEVVLEVDGPDAPRAVDLLADILASPGGEDYTI